jgi:hypothetical protein
LHCAEQAAHVAHAGASERAGCTAVETRAYPKPRQQCVPGLSAAGS